MEFLDRVEEKKRLDGFLREKSGGLACLYGRRRCGKTRLLRESLHGLAHAVYFLADRSVPQLQRARMCEEMSRTIPVFAQLEVPTDWGRLFDLWVSLSPAGSILVLDEFPYLVSAAPELPSIIQRIVDDIEPGGRKIVICGSSQRMMQGFVMSASEPLYGRAREIMRLSPLPFDWMGRAFPGRTFDELLATWTVFGGVPRYWELAASDADIMTSIRRLIMDPLGVLHDEPQFLLFDEVGDFARASSVLSLIGLGANRMSEIAARMGRKATELSHPLKRLTELGLIEREVPFGADETNGKKSIYRIADNFTAFWYTFIAPNLSRIDYLDTESGRAGFAVGFSVLQGQVWERLVRQKVASGTMPEVADVVWRSVARWWGTGLDRHPIEIDLVAESEDGETLLVGECKLLADAGDKKRLLAELSRKVEQLPFRSKYHNVRLHVFAAMAGRDRGKVERRKS